MTTEKKALKYKHSGSSEGQKRQPPYPQGISFTTSNSLNIDDSEDVSHTEKKTAHNALERQRREGLNSKFQELAHVLPSLQQIRRPSKSMIVTKSLEFVSNAISRESQYKDQLIDLRKENEQLRKQASLASRRLKNLRKKTKLDDVYIEKLDDTLAAEVQVEAVPSSSASASPAGKKQLEANKNIQSQQQQQQQQQQQNQHNHHHQHQHQVHQNQQFSPGIESSNSSTTISTSTKSKRQRDDDSSFKPPENNIKSNTKRMRVSIPFQQTNPQQEQQQHQYHIDFNMNQVMAAHEISFASYHNMVYPSPPLPPPQIQALSESNTPIVRSTPPIQYTYNGIHLIPNFVQDGSSENNNQGLFWNE